MKCNWCGKGEGRNYTQNKEGDDNDIKMLKLQNLVVAICQELGLLYEQEKELITPSKQDYIDANMFAVEHSKEVAELKCVEDWEMIWYRNVAYNPDHFKIVEKEDLREIFSFIDFSDYDGTDIMEEEEKRVDELEEKYLAEDKS
jgi:hypothetical protein